MAQKTCKNEGLYTRVTLEEFSTLHSFVVAYVDQNGCKRTVASCGRQSRYKRRSRVNIFIFMYVYHVCALGITLCCVKYGTKRVNNNINSQILKGLNFNANLFSTFLGKFSSEAFRKSRMLVSFIETICNIASALSISNYRVCLRF